MKQAFQAVETLLKSMKVLLQEAGIRCEMPTGAIERIPASSYSEIFDFLHNIFMSTEWAHAVRTRELVPDHVWKNLKLVGNPNMAEYRVLRKALAPVKKMWRPPCPFFGKHYEQAEIGRAHV